MGSPTHPRPIAVQLKKVLWSPDSVLTKKLVSFVCVVLVRQLPRLIWIYFNVSNSFNVTCNHRLCVQTVAMMCERCPVLLANTLKTNS